MTPREAIEAAVDLFVSNRDLMSELNRTSTVTVAVPVTPSDFTGLEANATPMSSAPLTMTVILTAEDTVVGRRLIAECEGRKEIVA